jgi:aminoglycoside phosphotransferase (APT) family kinase protein
MSKGPYYTKVCDTAEQYLRELFVYQKSLAFTPALIEAQPPLTLVLERVEGCAYLDHPEGFDPELLAATLAAFHLAFPSGELCLCHHDNQPGNILFNGSDYYFLDFSDSLYSSPLHDLTHMLLFWAEEFEPSRFERLVNSFMSRYLEISPVPTAEWQPYLKSNIERFDERRRLYARKAHRDLLRAEVNRDFLRNLYRS